MTINSSAKLCSTWFRAFKCKIGIIINKQANRRTKVVGNVGNETGPTIKLGPPENTISFFRIQTRFKCFSPKPSLIVSGYLPFFKVVGVKGPVYPSNYSRLNKTYPCFHSRNLNTTSTVRRHVVSTKSGIPPQNILTILFLLTVVARPNLFNILFLLYRKTW